MAISANISKVVSDPLLKETTRHVWSKCREMPFSHPKLNVNHNPPLAACARWVYRRRPCTRKAQGCSAKEDCLSGEEDDGFLLLPYLLRRCLPLSWSGPTAGTGAGAAAHLPGNTVNPEPRHLLGVLPGVHTGMLPALLCLGRGWQHGNYKQFDPFTCNQQKKRSCFQQKQEQPHQKGFFRQNAPPVTTTCTLGSPA